MQADGARLSVRQAVCDLQVRALSRASGLRRSIGGKNCGWLELRTTHHYVAHTPPDMDAVRPCICSSPATST